MGAHSLGGDFGRRTGGDRDRLVDRARTALMAPSWLVYRSDAQLTPGGCRWVGCDEPHTDVSGPWCWRHRAWHAARVNLRIMAAFYAAEAELHLTELGYWP